MFNFSKSAEMSKKCIYILDGLRVITFSGNLNFWVNHFYKDKYLAIVNIRKTAMCEKSFSCLKNSFCQNCGTILRYIRLDAFGVHVFLLVYIIVKICLYR